MNKTEQGCWQHCTKRQQRLDDSDLLAQFHIPSQGRPERLDEEQGEKGRDKHSPYVAHYLFAFFDRDYSRNEWPS